MENEPGNDNFVYEEIPAEYGANARCPDIPAMPSFAPSALGGPPTVGLTFAGQSSSSGHPPNPSYPQVPAAYPPALDPSFQQGQFPDPNAYPAGYSGGSLALGTSEWRSSATDLKTTETPAYPPPAYPGGHMGNTSLNSSNSTITTCQPGAVVFSVPQHAVFVTVPQHPVPNMTCHIVTSCLVFWLCGWVLGGLAYLFIGFARNSYRSGNESTGNNYRTTSIRLSVVGGLIGIVAWIVLILWLIDVIDD